MGQERPTYAELFRLVERQAKVIEEQEQTIKELRREVTQLRRQVEDLQTQLREAHRSTAPLRRREQLKKPEAEKKSPGREKGHPGAYRRPPEQIDQTIEVPLTACPHCAGELQDVAQRTQFIEEIPPVRPLCVKLTTWTGTCAKCGDVESRHPLQTSTATGAAGIHLGPRAHALALSLSHRSGLTMGRACQALHDLCGLKLTRGGLAQLLQRAAARLEETYAEIWERIRQSPAVYADETSWYVGQPGWWLWIFTTPEATLYRVDKSRGSDVVRDTLGSRFQGTLVSDCLASYNPIDCRKHKCIGHHLRVLKELERQLAMRGVRSTDLFLWKILLKDVVHTANNWKGLPPAEKARKQIQHIRGVANLLNRSPPEPEELAFRERLRKQRPHLLGCLSNRGVEPTNNRAERDLRPAVIDRKLSCGNKTPAGKRAWEIIRSVVTTVAKQSDNLLDILTPRMRLGGI